jgi:glutathione S-transferase
MIKIHNFARGVRGLRLMWQCEEMALPYQVEMVSFPPSAAFRALHPLGSVPFLEDDGGVAMSESVAIMLYLAHKYGPTPLLPGKDQPALARVIEMTVFGETALGMAVNPLLSAHFGAPEADKRNWTVLAQESRVVRALDFVVSLLGGNEFPSGPELTLADISVSCALGMWVGGLGKALPDVLVQYRERLAARPAYQRARASCNG